MIFSSYKNCKILITGGAGFIGSHLAEKLIEHGAEVTILDNFSTGSLANLAMVIDSLTILEGTITDYKMCLRATEGKQIIFHCAAQTSVPESMENPLFCYKTNVEGMYTLLEAARINKVQRFVFSSSSAVYGEREGKCVENLLCMPASPYGYSKLMGELLCQNYYRQFNLETVILRYFNVYGPRQDPHGQYSAAIAKFRYQMQQKKPIMMFGDGQQTRDFIPVSEVVQANLNLGMASHHKVAGEVFNIATGTSITLLQLIKNLQETEFADYEPEIMFAPARSGDIRRIEADCSKYRNIVQENSL